MSRTLVRYTIPLDASTQQSSHRLGVNSLAFDASNRGTLYSGGRDGIIAAWDLKMNLSLEPNKYDDEKTELSVNSIEGDAVFKRGIQAHTNWVNQIVASSDSQAIYSCSSDTLVKCWRPNAYVNDKADTIGSHTDYVKSLTVPRYTDEWIATGGLDRSLIMWDTSGKGERARIDETSPDGGMKHSIYSLASGPNLLASGGIEKVIRIWDVRARSRVTKFIGHTDNVRRILCSEDGKIFVSASSDTTIKIWDATAGRCLHTLTMHSDPVWTLSSDHPQLAVFHSADRSGLVLKHDLRPQARGGDDGECIAICKESSGVNDMANVGGHLYTATSSSSISRWKDTETSHTDPFADPELPLSRIESSTSARHRNGSRRQPTTLQHKTRFRIGLAPLTNGTSNGARANGYDVPQRLSSVSQSSAVSLPLAAEAETYIGENLTPIRAQADSIIHGQAGLTAHDVLSDRRRVLTRDADGRVKLWDIVQCKEIGDYGVVDMDDVATSLQSNIAIGSWCSVNTRMGALTVEMDPRSLLDAETYFDSIATSKQLDAETGNQKFNLGKWMLKSLFEGVISAEKQRDISEAARFRQRRPGKLDLGNLSTSYRTTDELHSTPRASVTSPFGSNNPYATAMSTPGAFVGLASPAPIYNPKPSNGTHQSQGSMSSLDSMASPTTPGDYFSSPHSTKDPDATPSANEPSTPNGGAPKTPGGGSLMKNMKWLRSNKTAKPVDKELNRTSSNVVNPLAVANTISAPSPELPPTNFQEFVDQQRKKFLQDRQKSGTLGTDHVTTWIQELEPMPELRIPPTVQVSLANFQPGEGEAKDLYRGSVGGLATDLERLKTVLPVWLGQLLLLNETPAQMSNTEVHKLHFTFVPHPKTRLPDSNPSGPENPMRLAAARSLRVRKALTYVSQRLGPTLVEQEGGGKTEEEWLEIVVNGTPVDPDWTLMMVRRHLWKQGADMKLEYRLKGET